MLLPRACAGIFVSDILDAVPIDKYFELFKPSAGGEGGFIRLGLDYTTDPKALPRLRGECGGGVWHWGQAGRLTGTQQAYSRHRLGSVLSLKHLVRLAPLDADRAVRAGCDAAGGRHSLNSRTHSVRTTAHPVGWVAVD